MQLQMLKIQLHTVRLIHDEEKETHHPNVLNEIVILIPSLLVVNFFVLDVILSSTMKNSQLLSQV